MITLNRMASFKNGCRKLRIASILCYGSAALTLAGCTSTPMLPYLSDTPAQVLMPIHAAGVKDGRARFREIFCERFDAIGPPKDGQPNCLNYLHRLTDEPAPTTKTERSRIPLESVRFIIIPGYMGDAVPGGMKAFGPSISRLAEKGYQIEYIQVSGGGGGEHNANEIAAYFDMREFPEHEKLVIIGYSKGTIDLLHFLSENPQFAQRVDALVSYSGAVNGSPLAEVFSEYLVNMMLAITGGDPGDKAGYSNLKPSTQMHWLASHPLPTHIKYFSLASFTDRKNVSSILKDGYDRLSQINPKNDGLLIYYDQILPKSTLLGFINGDHWAPALPFTEESATMATTLANRNIFPRDAMFEAVLLYVRENL